MVEKKGKVDTQMRYSPLKIPRMIRSHWRAKPKEALHLIGEPSTVKSDMVRFEAKVLAEKEGRQYFDWNKSMMAEKMDVVEHPEKYFVLGDIRASETDIGELRLQDLKAAQSFITFKYNILFEAMSKKEAMGILFFDEMNLAPNMIKAQFYKLINDRAIGDIPIGDEVLCISAGNEAEHSRGVTEDPIPLVLRRGNYFVKPLTSEEYLDYAVKTGHNQWVTGFLAFAPHTLHMIKYDVTEGSGQPCARTWSKLSNLLNNNSDLGDEDIEMHAIAWVGQGVGMEFAAYVRSARQIKLDDVLKNPKSINDFLNQKDLSIAYAIISGVVEKFRGDKKVIKPAFEICLHIERVELGAYLLRCMKNVDDNKFMKAGKDDAIDELATKVVERFAKYLIRT